MPMGRCPGQDKRFWNSDSVFEAPCSNCGLAMEFWKDEPRQRCKHCGENVLNPKIDLGCAKWCKFAEDCLGIKALPGSGVSLRDALVAEMKSVFGEDKRRVSHAMTVLQYAQQILKSEGGDPLVVNASAILHDIGILAAERKHGSTAGQYQQSEGQPIARRILQTLGIDSQRIEHICDIVASHHSADKIDTQEFRIIWDADRLANFNEECTTDDPEKRRQFAQQMFRTETGKQICLEWLRKAKTNPGQRSQP